MYSTLPKNTVYHQFERIVQPAHLDNLNHVNNVVYLQWVNEASEKHWKILANNILDKQYFWVALRHEIDYISPAFLGDKLQIITWVGDSEGVKSVRHVHILKQGKAIAKAKSTWCLLDRQTQRPTRIKEDILSVLRK